MKARRKPSLRIGIVGEKDYCQLYLVRALVRELAEENCNATIVTANVPGVCQEALQAAKDFGLKWEVYDIDPTTYKKRAPISKAIDVLYAFRYFDSDGIAHCMEVTRELGKPVTVFLPYRDPIALRMYLMSFNRKWKAIARKVKHDEKQL